MLGEEQKIWDSLINLNWKRIEVEQNTYLYRSIPYKGIIGVYLEQEHIKGIAFLEDIADIARIRSQMNVN
jgi:hypothetical protein